MDSVLKFVLFACIGVVLFSVSTTALLRFKPEIPAECMQQGYCEKIPNYPKDLVKKVIEELGEDFVKQNFQTETLDPKIAQRDGEGSNIVGLCNITEEIITPQILPDHTGTWRVILQYEDKNITQRFNIKNCNPGASCSNFIIPRPFSKYNCQQEYYNQHILSLDDKNEVAVVDIPLPKCCSCILNIEI